MGSVVHRRRRQLARQRRRERDRLARSIALDFGTVSNGIIMFARELAELHVNLSVSNWRHRAVLGVPTAEDISELLRRGFPLYAGLRGDMLAAYRRDRRRKKFAERWASLSSFGSTGDR